MLRNKMGLLKSIYRLTHKGVNEEQIPYYWNYSLGVVIMKPIRKWLNVAIIPYCPFSNLRVFLYRMIGYKIGKNVFIGMRCYLDDVCYDLMEIGDDVIISYGVYFASHGSKQAHNPIIIKDGAYIGMRANIIARTGGATIIGENSVVGACSLVNKSIPDGETWAGVPARKIESKNKIEKPIR